MIWTEKSIVQAKAKEYLDIKKPLFWSDPKNLDGLLNRFIGKEFGIAPDSFRLILV